MTAERCRRRSALQAEPSRRKPAAFAVPGYSPQIGAGQPTQQNRAAACDDQDGAATQTHIRNDLRDGCRVAPPVTAPQDGLRQTP